MVLLIIILLFGFVGLIKGADLFVDGSSDLARVFKVPSLIIGLTIVALGTSAPELAVSLSAALEGSNEIAFSNVVGSCIFNLLVVLGSCALICPVPVKDAVLKRDFPVSVITTFALFVLIVSSIITKGSVHPLNMYDDAAMVTRFIGITLFLCFILYIICLIRDTEKQPPEENEAPKRSLVKCIFLIITGVVMIILGGKAVVYSAKKIAALLGMSETLIGLTVVAVGTSLPELVTSVIASRKKETELAIGNVLGSNILNMLLILGLSAAIHPISINLASVYDLGILMVISSLTWIFAIRNRSINRIEGAIMIGLYIADMIFAVMR